MNRLGAWTDFELHRKDLHADWGPAQLDANLAEAWLPFAAWSSDWLRVERVST